MTDTELVKTIRCEGCGRTLNPAALFCTGCGTRREIEPEPVKAKPNDCPSCGVALRPGAEFCTDCGEKLPHGPIDLTVEETAAAAAALDAKGPDSTTETPLSAADRVSPAASRAILGSVSGGMGSYVGKASTGKGMPPPPVLPESGDDGDDNHRRNVAIIAIVAAVLVLIGGIAVLVATQKSTDGSLKAGEGSRGSHSNSKSNGQAADSSSDSTSGSSSSASSGSSGSTSGSASGSTTHSTSGSGSASKSGSTSGSGGKSSSSGSRSSSSTQGGTSSGGASSGGSRTTSPHGAAPPTRPAPTTPPAHMVLSTGSISVTGDSGSSVTVRNSGGKSMYWSISSDSMNNGTLHFSSTGGTLGGGASATVGVSWSGGNEGTGSGSFRVNGAGSPQYVSVSGDSREADVAMRVRQAGCGTNCPIGSLVSMQINVRAGGDFKPTPLSKICLKVLNGTNPADQCANYQVEGGRTVYQSGTGWVATIYWHLRWNSFTPYSTRVELWSVDVNGVESTHSSDTILG